ncbi:amidohydrolase family protein [Kineosporia succinea]|uniref:5-methylthioadenosine/S-adenosylhomocysteine deaminase n=1 Tax=Kineosporia succinea TaxID=84632 RepID=A0ABT9P767_9ACTN|nr:amidohydrolase family protein [Kineosporia succinea]MDP9828544.1 5-methylthioadenosine/S-adenosylhomocysteine deaminase [Kineosporia succinea]
MPAVGASREVVPALLVTGGDVVTMDPAQPLLPGTSVAVSGSTIAALGPAAQLRESFPGATELDASGTVVIPGLVDAHQHTTVDPLVRSLIPDDIPSPEAIYAWAVPLHQHVDGDDDELSATVTAVDCLTRGVTTVLDPGTVAHPLRVAAGLRNAGIRARVGGWGWDTPGLPFAAAAGEVLAAQRESVAAVNAGGGPVTGWVTLVGHDLAGDELFRGAVKLAEELNTQVTWHLSPGPDDPAAFLRRHGVRPVEHLDRIGALGERLIIAHGVWLESGELEALLRTRTALAACPGAYLRLGQGVGRAGRYAEFVHRGGRLALGCDSHNAGDAPDVLGAARLLAGLERDRGTEPPLRASDVLALATRAGAEAIGAPDLGVIAPGHQADLVLLDTSRPAWIPRAPEPDALARQIVWGGVSDTVRDVVVAGRVVVRDRRPLLVDLAVLREEAAGRRAALLARAGLNPRRKVAP